MGFPEEEKPFSHQRENLSCFIRTLEELQVGWPTATVYSRVRDFLGHWTLSVKIRKSWENLVEVVPLVQASFSELVISCKVMLLEEYLLQKHITLSHTTFSIFILLVLKHRWSSYLFLHYKVAQNFVASNCKDFILSIICVGHELDRAPMGDYPLPTWVSSSLLRITCKLV